VTLTDGDPATDLDGVANGSIEDPIAVTSVSSSTSSTSSSGGGGGCTLSTGDAAGKDPLMPVLVLTAIVSLYRRKTVRRMLSSK
jgi:hypothetical protein